MESLLARVKSPVAAAELCPLRGLAGVVQGGEGAAGADQLVESEMTTMENIAFPQTTKLLSREYASL